VSAPSTPLRTGNRSTAVMQRRHAGDRPRGREVAPAQLNYFPTPPWATRALCEFLVGRGIALREMVCWEPACGEMHMARALEEYFFDVVASDVHDYSKASPTQANRGSRGDDHDLFDFTLAAMEMAARESSSSGPPTPTGAGCAPFEQAGSNAPDFVITNPPFTLAAEFIASASVVARHGFAMLVRSAFLEGGERYRQLWSSNPPSFVLQFCERVVLLEGRLVQAGAVDPFAEEEGRKATTATSYVWLVWLDGERDTRFRWLAPCRERLERPSDYPNYAAEAPASADEGLFA
jgi:hypothetical protein